MKRANQKGVAMVMAIVLALVVSATAAVVLTLTFRRFELSAFRTDHTIAEGSDDAGLQYAFARLDKDTTSTNPNAGFADVVGFKNLVNKKRDLQGFGAVPDNTAAAEYVVTSDATVIPNDEVKPELKFGGKVDTIVGSPTFGQYIGFKNVTVRIRYFHNDPANGYTDTVPIDNRPYKIHSSSAFGTGGS